MQEFAKRLLEIHMRAKTDAPGTTLTIYTGTLEDFTGLASGSHAIALDLWIKELQSALDHNIPRRTGRALPLRFIYLSLPTGFAVHRFARLTHQPPWPETVDTDLWTGHDHR